jgi:hypothetical protein
MTELRSFETSGSIHPTSQHKASEDLNPYKQRSKTPYLAEVLLIYTIRDQELRAHSVSLIEILPLILFGLR